MAEVFSGELKNRTREQVNNRMLTHAVKVLTRRDPLTDFERREILKGICAREHLPYNSERIEGLLRRAARLIAQ